MTNIMHETQKESQVGGVSVRGWIAMVLVSGVLFCQTLIVMAQIYVNITTKTWVAIQIEEPTYSMVLIAIGFYFAKDQQKKDDGKTSA